MTRGDDSVPPARHRAPRRRAEHGARRGAPAGPPRGHRASHAPVLLLGSRPPSPSGTARPSIVASTSGPRRALGIGLVRRPTGGSAILHEGPDLELTYSVAARAGDFEGAADLLETYRWIGAALAAGLNRAGRAGRAWCRCSPPIPPRCPPSASRGPARTSSRSDGRKVVGSAQRRQGAGFLQHGAVMLGAAPRSPASRVPGRARSARRHDHARGGAGPAPVVRRDA